MNRRTFVKSVGAASIFAQLSPSPARAQQAGGYIKPDDPTFEGRAHRAVWGRSGVVATADQQASLAGVRMLMKGGNAIDAIVAAAAALNVVEPYMSGMTGFGGFMMIFLARQKKVLALDMMGISPRAASPATMTEADFSAGYKAPLVPGNVAGWSEALKAHGTMSLGDVFEPAIDLAENGFVVTRFDAEEFSAGSKKLALFPESARIFLPGGKPPREGQIVVLKDLASTFRKVARHGADVIYRGEIGDAIVRHLRENGGIMTREDLAAFKPRWRDPISTTFQGCTLYGMPPGSCEITMFQALNIMEGFDLKGMGPYSTDFAHVWLEATKLAFVDDDRFNTGKDVEIPVTRLISKEYAAEQRQRIRRDQVTVRNLPPLGTESTTSLAAADKWGNVVVLTHSLMGVFGSGVTVPGTGLLLNNGHSLGFVLKEGHVNNLVGGQHAKGVMCPTLVLKDGKAVMGIGASGAYTIPQTVGQALTKALVYGLDVQQAIASPRMIVSSNGDRTRTYVDRGFPADVVQGLQRLGHTLTDPGNMGAVQGVAIDPETGAFSGGADPRRDGHALAY